MESKGQMLINIFSTIEDPRIQRGRKHNLVDILVISFCGIFSGHRSWYEIEKYAEYKEDFFRSFLDLPNGIPSHDTFNRVYQLLSFDLIKQILLSWLREFQSQDDERIINIDGKFLNGSNKKPGDSRTSLGMVSAFATQSGICLEAEITRLEKEKGEKKTMEKVISGLNLRKAIVTLDAGGATPTIASLICQQKGDYIIGLKSNQKSFYNFAKHLFSYKSVIPDSFTTEDKGHGRKEKRVYELYPLSEKADIPVGLEKVYLKQQEKWKSLSAIIRVTTEVQRGSSKPTLRTRYYFTSLKSYVREIGQAIRSHWQIENNLHWVLDVHFMEDHCRTRTGYADANLALMRRLIISLIKLHKLEKDSIKSMMMGCNLRDDIMLKMLKTAAF